MAQWVYSTLVQHHSDMSGYSSRMDVYQTAPDYFEVEQVDMRDGIPFQCCAMFAGCTLEQAIA